MYICFDSVFHFSPLERSFQGCAVWSDSAMLAWCRGSTARSPGAESESSFSLERKCLLRAINLITLQRKFPKLKVCLLVEKEGQLVRSYVLNPAFLSGNRKCKVIRMMKEVFCCLKLCLYMSTPDYFGNFSLKDTDSLL